MLQCQGILPAPLRQYNAVLWGVFPGIFGPV